MNIILSIHPKWAKLIYDGKKTIEWRKALPKKAARPMTVYMYETSPVCKITGCFHVKSVEIYDKNDDDIKYLLKDNVERMGCLPIEKLNEYQGKSECVYGWRVITPIKFDTPKTLAEFNLKRPPQSWCYTEVDG